MKKINFKQYVAMAGYKPIKVWKTQEGYYAKVNGFVSKPNPYFTQVLSGGTVVRLSLKDVDNFDIVGKDVKVVFESKSTTIRDMVREILAEMEDEELEEISTTGNVSGYNTPNAFKKTDGTDEDAKPDSDYVTRITRGTGYTQVNEGTNRFHQLRKSEGTPNQKIGVGIRELRKQLSEMEKFVSWYGKIKTESGLDSADYWKRTQKHLSKISERLNKLTSKVRDLSV